MQSQQAASAHSLTKFPDAIATSSVCSFTHKFPDGSQQAASAHSLANFLMRSQ
jgi:hypothetical protein